MKDTQSTDACDTYFGWIPVLGSELVDVMDKDRNKGYIYAIADFMSTEVLPSGIRERVGGLLKGVKGCTHVFYKERPFEDLKIPQKKYHRLIALVEDGGFRAPAKVFVLNGKGVLVIHAEVTSFEKEKGLYSMLLREQESDSDFPLDETQITTQAHILVRDLYHCHNFICNTADVVMDPVKSAEREEALDMLWRNYYSKTVGVLNKRRAKEDVDLLTGTHTITLLLGRLIPGNKSPNKSITETYSLISSGMGQCLYGQSFAAKFFGEGLAKWQDISRIRDSYALFASQLDSDVAKSRMLKYSFITLFFAALTIVLTGLTIGLTVILMTQNSDGSNPAVERKNGITATEIRGSETAVPAFQSADRLPVIQDSTSR